MSDKTSENKYMQTAVIYDEVCVYERCHGHLRLSVDVTLDMLHRVMIYLTKMSSTATVCVLNLMIQ